jgi:hypothetical protein
VTEILRALIEMIFSSPQGERLRTIWTKLNQVLKRLTQAGFRCNVNKCKFAHTELKYLEYWLTRDGIQPQPKKVEAILRLQAPQTKR